MEREGKREREREKEKIHWTRERKRERKGGRVRMKKSVFVRTTHPSICPSFCL
jgi:hypothetical protein